MVRLLFFLSFFLLSAIQSVAGHGFVHEVNIEGKDFPGWNPFDDPFVARLQQSDKESWSICL